MKELRNQLQLTQNDLALLLGVSRPAIALYERGLRMLPAKAMVKLGQLQLLSQPKNFKEPVLAGKTMKRHQVLYQNAEKHLEQEVHRVKQPIFKQERELDRLRMRYNRLIQKLSLVGRLMEQEEPGSRRIEMLKNLEESTLQAIDDCCPARQLSAEYKLNLLKHMQQAALQLCNREKG